MAAKRLEKPVAPQEAERRTAVRLAVEGTASLHLLKHSASTACRVTDLSTSGCKVEILDPFRIAPGTPVEVVFKVRGIAIRCHGTVRWSDGRRFAGVQFVNMLSRRKGELLDLLSEVEADLAADAADKNSSSPGSSGEPLPPPGPKRRAQPRHEVDISAEILLVNTGFRLQGRILDLSLGGCRIQTGVRFPAEVNSRVEIKFLLKDFPFYLAGAVQTTYKRDQVGIRFLDVSDRKSKQVEELIAEIKELHAEGNKTSFM